MWEPGAVQMEHIPLYILMTGEFSCFPYIILKVTEKMKEREKKEAKSYKADLIRN